MDKSVLIYFSLSGNNKKFAENMMHNGSLDVIEFAPGGFGRVFQFFFGKSKRIKQVEQLNEQIKDHTKIMIYGPIWGGAPAPAVKTLVEHLNVNGKMVHFQISYTGNYGDSEQYIRDLITKRGGTLREIRFVQVKEKTTDTSMRSEI